MGKEGLKNRALKSIELANYAAKEMEKMGIKAWQNPNSITVIFAKPKDEICIKWQLASEGEWSHIICMPGISKEKIDEFLIDLKEAFKTSFL
jgi:histidine decarboxylase